MMSCVNAAASQHAPSVAHARTAPARGPHRSSGTPVSPPAARATTRTWRDPRLFVGVAIVAVCVLLGARLLAAADDTVAVWSLREDVPAGTTITASQLERVDLRFGSADLAARYLSAGQPLPEGLVLTREVAAGELLPRAALGAGAPAAVVEVPVALPYEAVPSDVGVGEVVDVWVTPDDGGAARAVVVLEGVRVVSAPRGSSALGPSTTRQIVVGVPADEQGVLASALARLATGSPVMVKRG